MCSRLTSLELGNMLFFHENIKKSSYYYNGIGMNINTSIPSKLRHYKWLAHQKSLYYKTGAHAPPMTSKDSKSTSAPSREAGTVGVKLSRV